MLDLLDLAVEAELLPQSKASPGMKVAEADLRPHLHIENNDISKRHGEGFMK